MSKIDIDKFICSLFKERIELLSIIKNAIKDQGLAYKDGEIVEINPKPKFNVGDWVVYNYPDTLSLVSKIAQIGRGVVYLVDTNGCPFQIVVDDLNCNYHLWSISDAKDGDVLCDYIEEYANPLIFILKKFECVNFGLVKPSDYSSYCFLTAGDRQRFKEGKYHHKHNIKPATKEQRDLLFQKMKEAGYYWMESTKELVSTKPLVEPEYDPHSLPVSDDSNLPTFNEDMFHPCTEKKENKEEEAPSEFIYEFLNIYHHSTPSDFTKEKLARYKKDITKIYRLAEKCLQPKFEKALSEVKGNLEDEYKKGYRKAIKNAESYLENILEEEDCKFGCSGWTIIKAETDLSSFINGFKLSMEYKLKEE